MGTQAGEAPWSDDQINAIGERNVHGFLSAFVASYEEAGKGYLPVVENARVAITRLERVFASRRQGSQSPRPTPLLRLVR